MQKILLDDTGLSYICQTYERFSHVAMILVSAKLLSTFYGLFLKLHAHQRPLDGPPPLLAL